MLKYFAPTLFLVYFLGPAFVWAAPPVAVKFVILQPTNSIAGTPVTVTIEAQKSNNQVDADYQDDVTLVISGSVTGNGLAGIVNGATLVQPRLSQVITGGGLVDIVNGVGTFTFNDLVAETVTLSLADSQLTGLDVSSVQQVIFAAPPDTIAPSAVRNLATLNVTTSSVGLSWTAPGDDGNEGIAAAYDIRYRTNNINNGNWTSATQVAGEPTPQADGTAQFMTISGLAENTKYFFAIRTSDEVPNESVLSNVVSTTTLSSGGGGGPETPALSQQKFLFRDDDGSEISASGFGAENVGQNTNIINVAPGTVFRMRFAVKLASADGSIAPRLEFKEGTDCTAGSWTTITPTTDSFILRLSDNFIDGAPTTQQLVGGPNFIAGQILKSTNPAVSLNMLKNQSTEYEWSLKASQDIPFAATYSFRITNNGAVLNTYDQCPSLITKSSPSSPPSSLSPALSAGGGGLQATELFFSGKAFPEAKILVVGKDISYYPASAERILRQDIVVNDDGSFKTSYFTVSPLNLKSFGLVVKDKEGRTAQTKFFNIDPLSGDLVVKDIIVSPTVGFTNRLVTRGSNATIIGYASPESSVALEIDGIIKKEVKAEKDGSYKGEVSTGDLDFGSYRVRAKQTIAGENRESDFSPAKTLVVSRLLLPKTDLSDDGRVDIKDWSMFLFRWVSKDQEQKKVIDFNSDGKVDISDFSIFVRNIRKI